MGRWVLENITHGVSLLDDAEHYGHQLRFCFRLRYQPALVGRFSEPPLLVWHEKFLMKEHHNNTWWEFETNMYEHNPASRTLRVWSRRYIEAYDAAVVAGGGESASAIPGGARLMDQHGHRVAIAELGDRDRPGEQARAVRDYLKKHGSILEIEFHDNASFVKPIPPRVHKERLLLFTIGVRGGTVWRMASQYLNADGRFPEGYWHRDCEVEEQVRGADMPSWNPAAGAPGPPRTPRWVTNFTTAGMTRVDPPVGVSAPRERLFAEGEYGGLG